MIEVKTERKYIKRSDRRDGRGRRRRAGRRANSCDKKQATCPKVYEAIERQSFELFPLKAMTFILSEGRLPDEVFRIKERAKDLERVIREQHKVVLTRLVMGRVESEYKIQFIRGDVVYYSCPTEKNKMFAISFSRLRREDWFIRFYNQWRYVL